MTNTSDTNSHVRAIVAEHLQLAESEISDNSTLSELGADSFDRTEIAMAIEEEFDIDEIPDRDVDQAITFGDLVRVVETRRLKVEINEALAHAWRGHERARPSD